MNDNMIQNGFIPLQQLQAMARQKMGGKQPQLTPRMPTPCPPKPDDMKDSSFYGDRQENQFSKKKSHNNNITNVQVQKTVRQQPLTKLPQSHIFSKYQIKQDTTFYIRFGVTFIQDRLIVTQQDKLNPKIESHWLKFRMWSYQQCNRIKNNCCQLDRYKNYIYNKTKVLRQSVKYLLLDWSFGIKDPNMRLMHVNKVLSDQSISLFMNMHPNILFYIQDKLKGILQGNK